MIARMWRGRVQAHLLESYRDYIRVTGLRDYAATPGNRGAYMITRMCDGYGDVATISFWESIEAIERFAGADVTRARYYPEDERFLLELPERVEHYDAIEAFAMPADTTL